MWVSLASMVTHSQAVLPFLLPLVANALLLSPLCPPLFLGREVETPVCAQEGCYPQSRDWEVALFHTLLLSACSRDADGSGPSQVETVSILREMPSSFSCLP